MSDWHNANETERKFANFDDAFAWMIWGETSSRVTRLADRPSRASYNSWIENAHTHALTRSMNKASGAVDEFFVLEAEHLLLQYANRLLAQLLAQQRLIRFPPLTKEEMETEPEEEMETESETGSQPAE